MNYANKYFKALQEGRRMRLPECPFCGRELKVVMYGLPIDELAELAEDENSGILLGGCICFDDDRDDVFRCESCEKGFTKKVELNELKECPLESCNAIRSYECRNYELLETKYELLDDREKICNVICPNMGKSVKILTSEGITYRGIMTGTSSYSVSYPGNTVTLDTEDERAKGGIITIYVRDIVSVEEESDGYSRQQERST